jgi:thiol:disulfide interchange protein
VLRGRQVAQRLAGRAVVALATIGAASCGGSASQSASPIVAVPPSPPAPLEPPVASTEASTKARGAPRAMAWEPSELEGRARAKRDSLPLLVYLRADWAAASLRQERELWTDPRVTEAARRFVALRIDLSSTAGDADGYLARYGIEVVPTTLLFDGTGRKVASLAGEVELPALLAALGAVD